MTTLPYSPKIKICGITRQIDAEMAIEHHIDALGFVFYAKSKRAVSIEQLPWLKNLPPFVQLVALFVNPQADFVKQVLDSLPIDICQFHGDESPDFCQQFTPRYIKAVPMQRLNQAQSQQYMLTYPDAAGFLLDNYGGLDIGGSGTRFDWQHIPKHNQKPLILAGGLDCHNVGEVLRRYRPYAVDVSSGVESRAGIKSAEKIAAFVKAVKDRDLCNERKNT